MKKLPVLTGFMISLTVFSPMESMAKPAYCDTDLAGCIQDCGNIFSGILAPLYPACVAGCYIGYISCGQ